MRFLAIEHALPSREVTNDDVIADVLRANARHLSRDELDTVEHLMRACFESAGTRVRFHRADGETATGLAVEAGERALAAARLNPCDVDLVLYAGIGRGTLEPATATIYQDLLGMRRATAFDVLDACAGWVRALHLAHVFLATGSHRNIMIVNAEFGGRESHRHALRSLDEFAHWHPSVTIGEAATATIVTADGAQDHFSADFRTWGDKRDLCFVPLDNFADYFGKGVDVDGGVTPMRFVSFGLRLMEFGTRKLIEHYRDSPQFEAFRPDLVFGHSASDGLSRHVLDACGIDHGIFRFGHHQYANTASASIPLALSKAVKGGALRDGHRVLLLVASAGVTTALTQFEFQT
ncbi:3-oxoacyl-[acyl-carrier-protein] synthase III C-terminal domain-containing protein [Streptomyces sp. NPDC058989]|uniref:3-oxoacyl-[acyl-carrier-protein] synthase III C-terminal domain-containing protein n=1 Tax=Streptomyces sp. NPDC058989 TaxID=3346686 RepID=UPI0036CAB6FB